jgi:hypothetical protein
MLFVALGALFALLAAVFDGLELARSPAARARATRTFLLFECVFLLALAAALAHEVRDDEADKRRRASGEPVVRTEPPFTVELPTGWRGEENSERLGRTVYAGAVDGARTFLYTAEDGSYFSVQVDGRDGGLRPDAVWEVFPARGRLAVQWEGPRCCRATERPDVAPACPEGNGQLDVRVLAASLTDSGSPKPIRLGEHTYRIQFGNVKREDGVDLEPFRRILASLRAK